MDVSVVRKTQAKLFLEGPEVCRRYFKTDKITFGSSELLPGQTGSIDPGHEASHEIFFVSRGHVILRTPDNGNAYELFEGDAIIMTEGVPHELTNIGMEPATITWSLAPSEF